eukprot:353414-Chlamydomonas_euryale.AAC.5
MRSGWQALDIRFHLGKDASMGAAYGGEEEMGGKRSRGREVSLSGAGAGAALLLNEVVRELAGNDSPCWCWCILSGC